MTAVTETTDSNDEIHPDPETWRGGPARRSPRAWILLLVITAIGLAVDLASKSWAFETVANDPIVLSYEEVVDGSYMIPWHPGREVIPPDLLDFRLVLNRGAVFGLGQGRRVAFVVFTMLAHVGIALILAGGIGNLYDRVSVGAVRDFLHMLPRRELPLGLSWPGGSTEIFPWVFNVADVELLAGMTLLLIHAHLVDRRQRRLEESRGIQAEASA